MISHTAMAAALHDLEIALESVDYRGIDDPSARVAKLLDTAPAFRGPLVLVGSSMGGHVAAAAAASLEARGLFLLAPAFYMPGFEAYTPRVKVEEAPKPPPKPVFGRRAAKRYSNRL